MEDRQQWISLVLQIRNSEENIQYSTNIIKKNHGFHASSLIIDSRGSQEKKNYFVGRNAGCAISRNTWKLTQSNLLIPSTSLVHKPFWEYPWHFLIFYIISITRWSFIVYNSFNTVVICYQALNGSIFINSSSDKTSSFTAIDQGCIW